MSLFKEYLNSKGKVGKAVVDVSGDRVDPQTPPVKPPKEHSSKTPYVGDGYKIKNATTGLADPCHCNNDLVYEPDTEKSIGKAPAKIPTAEQAEIVSLIADAAKRDATVIEQLVYQLRKEGLLAALVGEVLQHKDSYSHIAEVMGHKDYGPPVCNKLARAMNEEIAPPFHASMDQEIEDEEETDSEAYTEEPEIDDIEMETEMESQEVDDIEMSAMEEEPPMQQPNMSPEISSAMKNFQRAMMDKF